jgi:hypothetical protein
VAAVECFRCLALLLVCTRMLRCSPLHMAGAWLPGAGAGIAVGLTAALIDHAVALPDLPAVRLVLAIASCSIVLVAYYRGFHPQSVLQPLSALVGMRQESYVGRAAAA